jgi:hypothetical protein
MTRLRPLIVFLGLLSAVLAVAALWLAQDNPDIDNTSRGVQYTCAAPYDTVLNDADNVPGGEPPSDSDSIASRCIDAGEARFVQAVAAGAGAVVVACIAGGLAVRARRSTSASREATSTNAHMSI